jgi:hypothetical protein
MHQPHEPAPGLLERIEEVDLLVSGPLDRSAEVTIGLYRILLAGQPHGTGRDLRVATTFSSDVITMRIHLILLEPCANPDLEVAEL